MDTKKRILHKDLSCEIIGLAMEVRLAFLPTIWQAGILNSDTQRLGYERLAYYKDYQFV
jgi:hypothetical protein